MKRYIARHILLAKLAALALLTLSFVQPPVRARAPESTSTQATRTDDNPPPPAQQTCCRQRFVDVPPAGFVFGQTLRVTLAHVSGPAGQDQPPPNVQAGVWLLDSSGRVIAQSAQVQIPLNEFHSFDFNRAALPLPGEPGTGRLQVRARLVITVAPPYRITDDPRGTGLLVPSLELIDNNTGATKSAIKIEGTLTLIAD